MIFTDRRRTNAGGLHVMKGGMAVAQNEHDFSKGSIPRNIMSLAVPMTAAQLVNVLYSVVDRIYLGRLPGSSHLALTGLGITIPIVSIIMGFANLCGTGGGPLFSICRGRGDRKEAELVMGNSFTLLILFGAVVTAFFMAFKKPILYLFGASDATYPYANAYFTVYLSGTVFALLSTGLSQFILAQGFAKVSMRLVLLGAALNIALDPVFIFLLDMGVAGGALATVLSQMASAAYGLFFLFGKKTRLRITFGGYNLPIMGHVLAIGFTPFIIIAIDNVMIIAMNAILQRYGGAEQGDMLVTCATIAQSFMLVVTMPLGGISGGTQTILAFNYGARNKQRVLDAQKEIVKLCVGYTVLLFILARVAGHLFVRLFTQDPAVSQLSLWAIGICTLAIIPLGVQYEIVDGFTGMGQVRIAFSQIVWPCP